MKRIQTAILPLILLAACQTVPAPAAEPAPIVAETVADTPTTEASAPADATPAEAAPEAVATATAQKIPTYIKYETSPLVSSLVSESVMNDDVALMGLVSGARTFCGLDWKPGFVAFLNLANSQKLNLERVADDHGYYMGAAKRALTDAEYTCTEQDMIDLRKIEPY